MRFTIFLAVVSAAAVASAPVDERQPGETLSTSSVSSPPLPDETFSPQSPEGDYPHRNWSWRHHPRPQFDDPDSPPLPTPSETFSPPPSLTSSPTPLPSSST